MIYRVKFHDQEDTKEILLVGPNSSDPQALFESLLGPAAGRCLDKFQKYGVEVSSEDVFDEAVCALVKLGFCKADEQTISVAGCPIGHGQFKELLGSTLHPLLSHNEECQHERMAKSLEPQRS